MAESPLLPQLAKRYLRSGDNVGVALGEIGRELMDDYLRTGVSDAERFGEPLLVSWSRRGDSCYQLQVSGSDSAERYLEVEISGLAFSDPERTPADMFTLAVGLLRVGLNGLAAGDGSRLLELAALTGFYPAARPGPATG